MNKNDPYEDIVGDINSPWDTHDNKVYNSAGVANVRIGGSTMSEQTYQSRGKDQGTTVHVTPSTAEIISWSREKLGM
jgi:hypothetical protein